MEGYVGGTLLGLRPTATATAAVVLASFWASLRVMNFKLLVPVLLAGIVPLAVKRADIPAHLLGHVAFH